MTVREELYNGINIQKPWPPRMKEKEQALKKNIDRIPETICYLSNPPEGNSYSCWKAIICR